MSVRTAIVGLGYWGPNLFRNFAAQPDCDLAYGCDLEEKNLAKMRAHYPAVMYTKNFQELLADPKLELMVIATPTSSHFALAKKALEAGKHVLIEKPMTATAEEADELVALAKAKNLLLFVDHTFVFTSSVEKIASLVREGKIGDLLYYDSIRINLGIIQKDTNVLWDLAIHDLSILSAFTNLHDIKKIAAFGSKHFGEQEELAHVHLLYEMPINTLSERAGLVGPASEDTLKGKGVREGKPSRFSLTQFHAHISVSWLSPAKIRQTILAGTKSMITFHDTEPSEKLRIYDRGVEHDDTKPDPFFPKYRAGDVLIPAIPLTEALSTEAAHVLGCVEGKEKPLVPGEIGRDIIRILEAANEAMKNGKVMDVKI